MRLRFRFIVSVSFTGREFMGWLVRNVARPTGARLGAVCLGVVAVHVDQNGVNETTLPAIFGALCLYVGDLALDAVTRRYERERRQ